MESGDASDKKAPPFDPKSNNLMQKEWSKAISMLVDMETKDSLKRHAIMVVTKKIGLAHADLLYYKTKNILFLLCTPMVLIYNSELGLVVCSEFFHTKKLLTEICPQNKMMSHPRMEMTNDTLGCSRATQVHMEYLRLVNLTEISPSRRVGHFKAPC